VSPRRRGPQPPANGSPERCASGDGSVARFARQPTLASSNPSPPATLPRLPAGQLPSAPSLSGRGTLHRPRSKPVSQVPLEFMGRPITNPPLGWKPPAQRQFDASGQCGGLLMTLARDHDRPRLSGMLLKPFWSRPAHIVQLGPITV